MRSRARRAALLGGGMVIVFVAVVLVLLRVIPGPHRDIDYLVIGTLATFASLVTLFLVLISSYMKDPTLLFKRKKG